LQGTEAALEDIHNGVVDALPVVDNFVIVDAGYQENRTIVFASFLYALLLGLFGVPATLFGGVLF
jgi:hypothetical protein